MLKMIYISICALNVIMFAELWFITQCEIQKNDMHRIKEIPLLDKCFATVKFLLFAYTPILHLGIFISELVSLYTEEGQESFLDNALENYE